MTVAPDPDEIYDRAVEEGQRRLDQSMLELLSTGFIAGFTIIFGIIALAIVESIVHVQFESLAKLAGALAFGIGVVFLVVGRAELFNENFFDPIAAAIESDEGWLAGPLMRLWGVTFVLNLVGGAVFIAVLSVEGALPPGATEVLVHFAETMTERSAAAEFARAFTGGGLVVLLSFLLQAVDSIASRVQLSYVVGVLLALGPFDHVVVTVLHVLFGVFLGAQVPPLEVLQMTAVVTAGNIAGGVGFVTFAHVGQALGAQQSSGYL